MAQEKNCRLPTCSNPPENGSRYCSTGCELRAEHIEADARDAERADNPPEEGAEKRRHGL